MPKMILLFSHKLMPLQEVDAKNNLNINDFLQLPDELAVKFSNIPPELNSLNEYLKPIISWISNIAVKNDYLLIQGEHAASFIIADYALKNDLIPVVSTTKRIHEETTDSNGNVIAKKSFKHVIFRRYEKWQGF